MDDHAYSLGPDLGPAAGETHAIPLAVLAELTHRCPLQCPYCSNPVALDPSSKELTTDEWLRSIDELAEIGVLQIHFSGGEPAARKDLEQLVARANQVGLYTNLIGPRVRLTNLEILRACLRRPFGSRRVLALIFRPTESGFTARPSGGG